MRLATATVFPNESAVPVADPDRWVICLEHVIPHLDPIFAIVRERGTPARSIRIDAEAIPEEPRRVKPPAGADWAKIMEKAPR